MSFRHAAVASMLLLALVGCSRDVEPPAGSTPAPAPDAPSNAASESPDEGTASPAEGGERRSIERRVAAWRFQVDVGPTSNGGARYEVLTTPATVGAPPLRWEGVAEGELVDAFATDLDGDAWPELLLWWRDAGSLAEGRIEGWRFRPDGPRTALTLPALEADLAAGWRGRDQFGLRANALVRSFPVFREDDDNATPTAGFVRVVRYRLEGDALAVQEAVLEPMAGTPQAELLGR